MTGRMSVLVSPSPIDAVVGAGSGSSSGLGLGSAGALPMLAFRLGEQRGNGRAEVLPEQLRQPDEAEVVSIDSSF